MKFHYVILCIIWFEQKYFHWSRKMHKNTKLITSEMLKLYKLQLTARQLQNACKNVRVFNWNSGV